MYENRLEKLGYHWTSEFWRGLIENSVKAKARNVGIWISEEGRSGFFEHPSSDRTIIQVAFRDDGVGMGEHTIQNAFFDPERFRTLGKEKKKIDTALDILFFKQERYEIHMGGRVVVGDGDQYTMFRAEDALRHANDRGLSRFARNIKSFMGLPGCAFVIDVNAVGFDFWSKLTPNMLRNDLYDFVRMSNLPLDSISLDGKQLDLRNLSLRKGSLVTSLSAPGFPNFASVHEVSDGDEPYDKNVFVRVNGVLMYGISTQIGDKKFIVELDPLQAPLLLNPECRLYGEPSAALREFLSCLSSKRDRENETRDDNHYGSCFRM